MQSIAGAARSNPGELTLDRLETGLPNRFRTDLLKACAPLSGADKQPPRQDLRLWWKTAEAALLGMGPTCNPLLFSAVHVAHVAPVLLGPAAWGVMCEQRMGDWADFKSAVEARYGLSRRACLRAFFDMTPEADEATGDFLRRVEDMRARYGVDKEETRRHFVKRLREEDLVRLDELSDVCALLGGGSDDGELEWDQLVRLADHRTTHAPLSSSRAAWQVTGFGRPVVAAPTPGAVAAQPSRPTVVDSGCYSRPSGAAEGLCGAVSQPCKLCSIIPHRK